MSLKFFQSFKELIIKSEISKEEKNKNGNSMSSPIDDDICSESSVTIPDEEITLNDTIEMTQLLTKPSSAKITKNAIPTEVEAMEVYTEKAEARLAQRRQARAEARDIRMRELERQQKEQERNADRVFDMQASSNIDPLGRSSLAISSVTGQIRGNSMSSRRSSEDSLEEEGRSLRDIRHELKDVEERFRKAMIANAQLDNERASQSYQIQLLKDKLEEMEEAYAQLQLEHKDKYRDHDALKRNNDKLNDELKLTLGQLNERDTLIAEQGLTIVIVENDDGTDASRALVSAENAQLLDTVQGSLDARLKKFAAEKQSLKNEVQQLHQQLLNSKTQRSSGSMNGPLGDGDYEDVQREANKQIADYRYKLEKTEQEIASLQASLARSETQVIRYKKTADAAEKAESELKLERRKLQREDVEERFRKAMIANAQLDNERASQSYQIQLLKDKLEEMEEAHAQLQLEHKDKCRDHDAFKRNNDKLNDELKLTLGQLNERDTLIAEKGLAIVIVENDDGTDASRALVSAENAQLLDTVQGSLDARLKKFAEEKQSLKNEVQQLHQQLLNSKTQRSSGSMNGPLGNGDYEDVQREANKQIADYRYKLQKAEQEIASLQASLARSETQVIRYKKTADAAEKAESELKLERRKLQREEKSKNSSGDGINLDATINMYKDSNDSFEIPETQADPPGNDSMASSINDVSRENSVAIPDEEIPINDGSSEDQGIDVSAVSNGKEYHADDFLHDSPVAATNFDSSATCCASPSRAYTPQSTSTSYHHFGHSPHLGTPHGYNEHSLSPGVTHTTQSQSQLPPMCTFRGSASVVQQPVLRSPQAQNSLGGGLQIMTSTRKRRNSDDYDQATSPKLVKLNGDATKQFEVQKPASDNSHKSSKKFKPRKENHGTRKSVRIQERAKAKLKHKYFLRQRSSHMDH